MSIFQYLYTSLSVIYPFGCAKWRDTGTHPTCVLDLPRVYWNSICVRVGYYGVSYGFKKVFWLFCCYILLAYILQVETSHIVVYRNPKLDNINNKHNLSTMNNLIPNVIVLLMLTEYQLHNLQWVRITCRAAYFVFSPPVNYGVATVSTMLFNSCMRDIIALFWRNEDINRPWTMGANLPIVLNLPVW